MPRREIAFLIFCLSIFLALNIFTIKDGHNWGDDTSQYLLHAQNLAQGKDYNQGLLLDAWIMCPWGFPLLLCPIVKFFGINFILLKLLNVFWWLVFAVFLFLLAQRQLGKNQALMVTGLILFSPFLFIFKQSILSEWPFMAFMAAGLYVFSCYGEENPPALKKTVFFWISIGLMVYVYFLRVAGGLLLASAIFYLAARRQEKRLIGILGVLLLILLALSLKPQPEARIGFFDFTLQDLPGAWSLKDIDPFKVLGALAVILTPPVSIGSLSLPDLSVNLVHRTAFVILAAIVIPFLFKVKRRTVTFVECFFVLYFIAIMIWPIADGIRYALPLAGLSLIFLFKTFHFLFVVLPSEKYKRFSAMGERLIMGFCFLVFLLNVIGITLNLGFNDDEIKKPATQELIRWMKTHMKEDEVFMFIHARAMCLFTDRKGVLPRYYPWDKKFLVEHMQRYRVAYYIKFNDRLQPPIETAYRCDFEFRPLWSNASFSVYAVAPAKACQEERNDIVR
jgi:hypothetical protein